MTTSKHEPSCEVKIRKATVSDLKQLVDLHYMSFTPREHLAMLLGRNFIQDIYRWFITSSETFTIVAEVDSRVVGMANGCDRRYDTAMIQHARRSAITGFLKHPWLILHPEFVKLALGKLLDRDVADPLAYRQKDTANLAFVAVDVSMRGYGVANRLLIEAKRTALQRGKKFLWAAVYSNNTVSKRTFEKAGFRQREGVEIYRRIFMEADLCSER